MNNYVSVSINLNNIETNNTETNLHVRTFDNSQSTEKRRCIRFSCEEETTFYADCGIFPPTLYYSIGKGWKNLDRKHVTFGGKNGDLLLCGENTGFYDGMIMWCTFVLENDNDTPVDCYGDIMSLLDYKKELKEITQPYCFEALFRCCSLLRTAPDLSATVLSSGCYRYMFDYCTSLTNAPELPATALAEECYEYMFRDCASLVEAPDLPATLLEYSCYYGMFSYCTSLIKAPELPVTSLQEWCYERMFEGCTSLIEAPELPAILLSDGCYSNMFRECHSLIKAPKLSATILAPRCYLEMFRNCTSLVEVSELPAVYLERYCYNGMFQGCTSLEVAPEIFAVNDALNSCNYMFKECTSLKRVKCHLNSINKYESTDSTYHWMYNIYTSGILVKKAGVVYPRGYDGVPNSWTIEEFD